MQPTARLHEHGIPATARVAALALLAWAWLVAFPSPAHADGYDVLAECMALTSDEDEIHGCLDNYLDVMDDNLGDLEAFLGRELDGEALAGFERSQSAFASYRRENCLWYLGFNSPRAEAEKIAKSCLARMSLDRLAELQSLLVRDDGASRTIDGFYVYGANRNSFRPCGANTRFWVEGDAKAVGALQEGYSRIATADLQVMFASVVGGLEEGADAPIDHDGVLRVRSVRDVRVPSDGDCRLPDGSPPVTSVATVGGAPSPSVRQRVADTPSRAADAGATDTSADRAAMALAAPSDEAVGNLADDAPGGLADRLADGVASADAATSTDGPVGYPDDAPTRANPVADPDALPPSPAPATATAPVPDARETGPTVAPAVAESAFAPIDDDRLTAYFGAWLADCDSAVADGRRCRVAVDLGEGGDVPELALVRRGRDDTTVEVAFPDRAIATANDVDWAIDGYAFGVAGGGDVSTGRRGTVLRLGDRRFVGQDLLPLMKGGSTVTLDVRASDGSVRRLEGTLVGLTRALRFADRFLAGGGS